MPSIIAAGSVVSTPGVEQILATVSVNRTVIGLVGVSTLAQGDGIAIRVYRRVLASGTDRLIEEQWLTGPQPVSQIAITLPYTAPEVNYRLAIFQVRGVARTLSYSLEQP